MYRLLEFLMMNYHKQWEEVHLIDWEILRSIYLNASKRISSNNPQKLAYDACFELYSNDKGNFNPSVNKNQKDCINDIISSLSINRLQVIAKYMTARHIIPFLGSREINLTEDQEKSLKDIYYDDKQGVINKGKNSFNYFLKNYSSFNLLEVNGFFSWISDAIPLFSNMYA